MILPSEKAIEIYNSDRHLLAELKQHLQDRKRVFVTSNSKRRIDDIEAAVANELEGVRVIKITSDTGRGQASFVANPSAQAMHYDLILTSPSLGTGVDITFDDQQQLIDVVYGFFEARITTHFDIDQQLARVRQPGGVKVWISPQTFRFDTARRGQRRPPAIAYKNFLDRFDARDAPVLSEDDPFLDLASLVVSHQRASKNNLKHHFIELKKRQGYEVHFVAADATDDDGRQRARQTGKHLSDRSAAPIMLAHAAPLRKAELEDVQRSPRGERRGQRRREVVGQAHVDELFYRERIIARSSSDDRGRLRKRRFGSSACGRRLRLARRPRQDDRRPADRGPAS